MTLDAEYPEVHGIDPSVSSPLNAYFEDKFYDLRDAAMESLNGVLTGRTPDYQTVALMYYQVPYNQNDLLSIVLNSYLYAGGDYPTLNLDSYTVNLATGQALKVQDLFSSDSDYAPVLNEYI